DPYGKQPHHLLGRALRGRGFEREPIWLRAPAGAPELAGRPSRRRHPGEAVRRLAPPPGRRRAPGRYDGGGGEAGGNLDQPQLALDLVDPRLHRPAVEGAETLGKELAAGALEDGAEDL